MNFSPDQIIKEIGKLPINPQVTQKALAVIGDPDVNASSLAHVIETDQVLAAHVLRWANSAYYGAATRITTIQQSIVALGINNIRKLIQTHPTEQETDVKPSGYELRKGDLWRHAVGTAIGARLISKQHHLKVDEEAYVTGLLCDIGKVVFDRLLRESEMTDTNIKQFSYLGLERVAFGVDHAGLGSEIASLWELPESLSVAIAHHHDPQAAGHHVLLASIIHVADCAMITLDIGHGVEGLNYPLDIKTLKSLGMTLSDLHPLMEKISEQLKKAGELVNLGLG